MLAKRFSFGLLWPEFFLFTCLLYPLNANMTSYGFLLISREAGLPGGSLNSCIYAVIILKTDKVSKEVWCMGFLFVKYTHKQFNSFHFAIMYCIVLFSHIPVKTICSLWSVTKIWPKMRNSLRVVNCFAIHCNCVAHRATVASWWRCLLYVVCMKWMNYKNHMNELQIQKHTCSA